MSNTKFRKAVVYVTDNGYTVSFSEYQGAPDAKQGYKVAKRLDEVHKELNKNLMNLVDTK